MSNDNTETFHTSENEAFKYTAVISSLIPRLDSSTSSYPEKYTILSRCGHIAHLLLGKFYSMYVDWVGRSPKG